MRLNRLSLRKKLALSALIAAAFSISTAQAQLQWDPAISNGANLGGSGTWDAALGNWYGASNVAWDSLIANFGGAAGGTVNLSGALTATGLNFNTTGYTLAGGTSLTLGAGSNIDTGAGISATISSILAGTTVNKTGAGTLTLSGANTFTGAFSLNAGTLRATTSASALGTGATATLTMASGTSLELANDTGLSFGRNTTLAAGAGTFTITSDRLTAGAGVTHVMGTLATGTGGQILAINAGSNVTSGTAGVTFGAVTLNSATTFSVGAGALLTTTGVVAGGANAVNYNLTGDMSVTAASMTGSGAQTKSGPGTLTFTADPNQTGAMTINGGVVALTGSGTIDFPVTINATGTLRATSASLSGNNDVAVNGGTLDVRVSQTMRTLSGTAAGVVTNGGAAAATLTVGNGSPAAMTYNGVIQNGAGAATLGLTLASNNGLTLTNTSNYTGNTAINAGTLTISTANGALTGTSITMGDNNGGNEALTVGAVGDVVAGTLNRLGDIATITLNAGSAAGFVYSGPASGSGGNVETIGGLVFNNNRNTLTIVPGTGNDVQLTTGTLTRSNNGVGLIRGDGLGTTGVGTTRLLVTTPVMSGSNGADGTTSKSIFGFLVGDTSSTGAGTGFLTHDAVTGVRLLSGAEYDGTIAGLGYYALRNVSPAGGETVSANTNINSLLVANTGTTTINSPASVVVSSGAVQFTDAGTIAGTGRLSYTAAGGMLGVSKNTTAIVGTVNARIDGLGTIAVTGNGDVTNTIELGGNNNFNGTWLVHSSNLRVGNTGAFNITTPNAVTLAPGGNLQLNGNSVSVRDLATITGSGTISNTSNTTATLTTNLTAARTINSVIANGTGAGVLNLDVFGGAAGNALTIPNDASATGSFTGRSSTTILSGANGTLNDMTSVNLLGATLRLTNTNTANNGNRILNTAPITLNRGTIDFDNNASAANFSETIGAITLAGSVNVLTVDRGGTSNTSTLTAASLTRTQPGATLILTSQANNTASNSTLGIDNRSRLVFTTAPTLNDGIIGGWAVADTTAGREFAKYVSSGTISATHLVTADYNIGGASIAAAATTTNVLLTAGETLPAATPKTINSLTINQSAAATVDLGANTLTVDTGGIAINGAFNSAISNGTLTAGTSNEVIVHNNTANPLTISAVIADNGNAVSFTRFGAAGTTILSAVNTYTGKTFVPGGTLSISSDANLGAVPGSPVDGAIVLSSGGTLAITENMTLNANRGLLSGSTNNGAPNNVSIASGTTALLAKSLTYNGKLESINDGSLVFLSNASGTNLFGGSVALSPSNTLDLSGSLRVDQGTVTLAAGNNVIRRSLQVGTNNSGTTSFTQTSGTLTVGSGVDDVVDIANNLVQTHGTNTTLKGNTVFNLTGTSNFTANVDLFRAHVVTADNTINSTTTLATNNDINARTQVQLGHSAGVDMSAVPTTITLGSGINNITTPLLTWGSHKSTTLLSLPAGGVINLNGFGTRTMDFYVGRQNVNTGTTPSPVFNAATGVVNASLNNWILAEKSGGGIGGVNATASIGNSASNYIEAISITLGTMAGASGTTTGISRAFGTLNFDGGQLISFGDINLGTFSGTLGTARGNLNITGGSVVVGGNITKSNNARSAGMLLVDGASTTLSLQHTAAGDTTQGTITVSQLDYRNGTISNVSAAAFDGRGVTDGVTTANLAEALILRDVTANFPVALTNPTANQGGIRYNNTGAGTGGTINGTVDLGSVSRTINVDNSVAAAHDLTIVGGISGTGAVGITKSGAGTLRLSGTSTYTGTTTVSAGTLLVNGSIATSSDTSVANGATLGGSGTTGPVTLVSGATVSPGNSPGTINTGSTTWVTGANYDWQALNLSSSTPSGTNFDTWNVAGTLDIQTGFNFNLFSLASISPDVGGDAAGFINTVDGYWRVASATTLTNGANLATAMINQAGFTNTLAGGTFSLVVGGTSGAPGTANDIYLYFDAAAAGTPTFIFTDTTDVTLNVLRNGSGISAAKTIQNNGGASGDAALNSISNLSVTGTLTGIAASGTSNLTLAPTSTASNLSTSGTLNVTPDGGANDVSVAINVGNAAFNPGDSKILGTARILSTAASNVNYNNTLGNNANWSSNTAGLTESGIGTAPALATTATVLRYDNTTGTGTETVSMQWRTRTTAEANLANTNAVLSDIVNLTGMYSGSENNTTGTGVFVLQMSYLQSTLTSAGLSENSIATSGELRLGWNDGGVWKTAGLGNQGVGGGTATFVGAVAYDPMNPLHNVLGAYGVDPSDVNGGVVWAVLNHNSEFAVIPEPSTLVLGSLALLGLAGVGLRRRRLAKPA